MENQIMTKKIKKQKINLTCFIILLGVALFLFLILKKPIVTYEYYINEKPTIIPGQNFVGYDCPNDVKVEYDITNNRYKASNVKKNTVCKLYFEDNIYDEINLLADSSNDDIIEDNKIIKNSFEEALYYGIDAKNYVYFNCDDYTKQSSDTCEVWRIIKTENINHEKPVVKLIRDNKLSVFDKTTNTNLAKFSWHYTKDINELEFIESDIYDLLNQGYLESDNNYEYVDNTSNIHYLDFSKSGIKNKATKNMLVTTDFRVARESYINATAGQWVRNEATGSSMMLEIGLPTISDYVSSIGKVCEDIKINSFAECTGKSYINITDSIWTLNVSSYDKTTVYRVSNQKTISPVYPTLEYEVYPTLYIDGNLKIVGGDGSKDRPYQLL